MSTTQPIRNPENLELFKNYYKDENANLRNYTMIILGLNTALRISDILHITWGDVFDFDKNRLKEHLYLKEQKTGKRNCVALNQSARICLLDLYTFSLSNDEKVPAPETYLFRSRNGENQPLCRCQAFRIIKKAAAYAGYPEHISCHSLRKTFGYYAWKQGVQPAMLMNIYNHSSYQITKRYLGIEQDDRDNIFLNLKL